MYFANSIDNIARSESFDCLVVGRRKALFFTRFTFEKFLSPEKVCLFLVSTVCLLFEIRYMTYTILLFTKTSISEKNPQILYYTFILVSSYFETHPITLLLEILGGRMHGPSLTSNFGGTVPSVPLRSPPMIIIMFVVTLTQYVPEKASYLWSVLSI